MRPGRIVNCPMLSVLQSMQFVQAEVAKSNTVADGCWRKREYAQHLSENESTNGSGSEGASIWMVST